MSLGLSPRGLGARGGVAVAGADGSDPQVLNVSPAVGSAIGPNAALTFDVVATNPSLTVIVSAMFPSGAAETAFAGQLMPAYKGGSTVTGISGGYRFSLLRAGGWAEAPTLSIAAFDSVGNSLLTSLSWSLQAATEATASAPVIPLPTIADPLGFGVARPFRRAPYGDIATASGSDLVRMAVGQVLGTSPGEVPWRPSFGVHLRDLRHRSFVSGFGGAAIALGEAARASVEDALRRWVPQIRVVDVTVDPPSYGDTTLEVGVTYTISDQVGSVTLQV